MADESHDAISEKRILSALDNAIRTREVAEKGEKIQLLLRMLNSAEAHEIFAKSEKAREQLSVLADSLISNYPEIASPEIMETLMNTGMKQDNLILDYMKSIVMANDADQASRYLRTGSYIPSLPTSAETMKKMAFMTGDYEHASIILSSNGRFDKELFSEYVSRSQTEIINSIIIRNFKEKDKLQELSEFLKMLRIATNNQLYGIELAAVYSRIGDIKSMKSTLNGLDQRNIKDGAQKNTLAELYISAGEFESALSIASELLSSGLENQEIIKIKALSLFMLKREEECLYFLQQKESYCRKNEELLLILCKAGEAMGNYRVPLDILSSAESAIQKNQVLWRYLISFLVKDSKFDLANKKLSEMEKIFPDSKELFEARLALQITLKKDLDAINTSQRIFEKDPGDYDAADVLLKSLFSSGGYRQFLDVYERSINAEIISGYRTKAASAILFLDGVDAFVQYLKKYSIKASEPEIIESILSTIRSEEQIRKLQPLIEISGEFERGIIGMIISWVKGIPISKDDAVSVLEKSCSEKFAAMAAMPVLTEQQTDSLNSRIISCGGMLIASIQDSIKEIKNGTQIKNIADYPFLNYPLTQILISTNRLKEASELLVKSTNPRDPDPYYYYLDGVIAKLGGNSSAASKSVEKALDLLDAVPFRVYYLKEYIEESDGKHVISEIEKIIKMGAFSALPFPEIYEFTRTMDGNFSSNLIDLFDYSGKENIFTMRIRRDHLIETMDDPKAIDLSKQIIGMNDRNARDVMTYLAVLKRSGKGSMIEEDIEVLYGSDLSGEIHASFGDYYQSKGEFDNAIYQYKKAEEAGYDPDKMPGYPDCLIEMGKFQEAARVLSKIKNKGILEVKLLARSGEIEKVTSLLKNKKSASKSDSEIYTFIVLTLWKNTEIRDTLISLFEREGEPTLGKLIARKLLDSRDNETAIHIMKNVLKNAPLDCENAIMLCETLARMGREEEANIILRKMMKENLKKEDLQQLFTVLTEINYNARLFENVMKAFEDYPMLISKDSLNYIVRSMIELEFYDKAEKLISKLHNKMIPQDRFDEYHELLRKKEEIAEVLYFAVRVMKLEFKAGRKLDQREAIIKAEIPVEIARDVFEFFRDSDPEINLPAEAYDALSKETLKAIRKKTNIRGINEVTISVLFNLMPRKDPVVAKNLYIYIRRLLKEKRIPKTEDEELNRMLRIAMKENLKPDPINIIARFDIGLNRSLELLALMDYVSKMNPWR